MFILYFVEAVPKHIYLDLPYSVHRALWPAECFLRLLLCRHYGYLPLSSPCQSSTLPRGQIHCSAMCKSLCHVSRMTAGARKPHWSKPLCFFLFYVREQIFPRLQFGKSMNPQCVLKNKTKIKKIAARFGHASGLKTATATATGL